MNIEANRLATFSAWPSYFPVDVHRIARAGFYATDRRNAGPVQCHWCQQRITDWRYGDQVMSRHRQLDPLCPFICDPIASGNVPLQTPAAVPPASAAAERSASSSPSSASIEEPDNRRPSDGIGASATEPIDVPVDYMDEQCRLDSFANWPITCVTPRSLARAGFYYYNHSDHVRCAWCQGVIAKWEEGDKPFVEHGKFFPRCPRVMCGPNVRLVTGSGPAAGDEPPLSNIESIGIQMHHAHQHDAFAALAVRLESFRNWRYGHVQSPEALAAAGFYCLDSDDFVRCFHCSGGLRAWLPTDDPWHEHARHFPRCGFLEMARGRAFVHMVQSALRRSPAAGGQVSPEQLDECLGGEMAQRALDMGFALADVRQALARRLADTGEHFDSIDDLVLAILSGKMTAVEMGAQAAGENAGNAGGFSEAERDEAGAVGGSLEAVAPPLPAQDDSLKSILSGTANDSSGQPLNLEDENRKLKDAIMCKVCMVEEVGIVFLPCGHLVSCVQCATSVSDCPLCRTKIKAYVRTYLS